MAKRTTLLVPVDLGEPDDALDIARELAASLGAELCLLHVSPVIMLMYAEIGAGYATALRAEALEGARMTLELRAEAVGASRTLVREGDAAIQILRVIDEEHPLFVVMGTHARRGIGRLVLGSVAERVARESAAPVITIHPRDASAGAWPRDNVILVPMDFDASSAQALTRASQLARALGSEICLLHVNALIRPEPEMGAVYAASIRADTLHAERFLDEHARSVGAARTMLRQGDPASEILTVIDELRPRFVVMGTHGRGGIGRVVLGSVTGRVTRESRSPVMSVSARAAAAKKSAAA